MLGIEKGKKSKKLFGELAVEKNLVSSSQVRQALREQEEYKKARNVHKKIGTILIEKGFLTSEDVQKVLKDQNPHAKLITWFVGLFNLSR